MLWPARRRQRLSAASRAGRARSIFTGGFAKGLPNGTSGTFSVARGEGWYRGGVLNGLAHGEGTVATPDGIELDAHFRNCLLYTSPSPRDRG